jgi:hypothetical protein
MNQGGRIGFVGGNIVVGKKNTDVEGLFGVRAVRSPADKIPGATKFTDEWVYFKKKKDAENFKKAPPKVTMKPGATPSNDPKRLKRIHDFVKKYEKIYGVKPSKKRIQIELKEQVRVMPFYEEKYGKLPVGKTGGAGSTKIIDDVRNILNDKKIKIKLDQGKFPTITDVVRVTKLDPTLAETRLVDVAEKLKSDPKYKQIATDYLEKPGLTETSKAFGGRKTARSRILFENRFTKLMNLDQKLPSLRKNILNKLQRFIPELKGKLAVDEIAGVTTSMRRGSGPYAIFGQVLGSDFNSNVKGYGIDKNKGFLEKKLVTLAKDDPERIKLQKNYNKKVDLFEASANKDNPAKKVRGLKVSFKPPSETIKNKKIYNQYKDLFDTHYKKYGYSFEVPADRDSLVDISKKLDNKSFQNIVKNRFSKLIGRGGKIGALVGLGTLAGTGFALADEAQAADGTEARSILPEAAAGTAAAGAVGTKPGRKLLGKAFRTLGTRAAAVPFAAWTISDNLKKGENVADAVVDPLVGAELMLPNLFKENVAKITSNPTLQKLLKVGKYGRMFTPVGAGITAAGLGIDAYKYGKKRIAELQAMSPEQRAELRRQADDFSFGEYSGAAEGGIASLKKKW